jgi:hypothetical protein
MAVRALNPRGADSFICQVPIQQLWNLVSKTKPRENRAGLLSEASSSSKREIQID